MAKDKKLPKVFDSFKDEDPFAGGLTLCPGCTLELLLRFTARVLGKEIVLSERPLVQRQFFTARTDNHGTSWPTTVA